MEILYKRSKTGEIQYWRIDVIDNVIRKESGKLGTDKPLIHTETVHKGVNEGKANETTPKQQAEAMAYSDWKKKKDQGYKSLKDLNIIIVGPTDECVQQNPPNGNGRYSVAVTEYFQRLEQLLQQALPQFNTDASGNVKPMLATDWKKIKKIDYPVLVQPKLDGVRCLMIIDNDNGKLVKFLSRSGKEYTTLGHIERAVVAAKDIPEGTTILDGEIYSDELTFQEITQAVKKQYPNSLKLHFRAYDIVHEDGQEDRVIAHMPNIVKAINSPYIHAVPTNWADNADEVTQYHNLQVQTGFEGAMIRIPHGKYEQGCRSRTLLKVKEFDETEFTVIGHSYGQRDEDLIFHCTCDGGNFNVKMTGSRAEKERLYKELIEPMLYIDSKLVVKHFGWTDDGLPRFPVGKAIRDYE